jgi:hypothetical protein
MVRSLLLVMLHPLRDRDADEKCRDAEGCNLDGSAGRGQDRRKTQSIRKRSGRT